MGEWLRLSDTKVETANVMENFISEGGADHWGKGKKKRKKKKR